MTIIGISRMAVTAEKAAERLASEEEIDAEVIDPRTLRPLDLDTILESVRKTNRCVVVEEGWPHGGVGANVAALIQEQAFDYLDAPIQRVTGADVPMPYSKALEQAAIPARGARRHRGRGDVQGRLKSGRQAWKQRVTSAVRSRSPGSRPWSPFHTCRPLVPPSWRSWESGAFSAEARASSAWARGSTPI